MALELYPGEELVTTTRPHARTLFWPIVALFSISALVGAGVAIIPVDYRPIGQQIVVALGVLASVITVLRPVLRRAATSVTLTTQRLIVRTGLVRRAEHEIPLNRVVNIASTRAPVDFGFGTGTLLLTTLGGHQVRLTHMPQIKAMRQAVSELAAQSPPELFADSWSDTRLMGGPGQWH